jgi:acylphosphatase
MITRRYIVHGRVQGVGFRYYVSQMAGAFDLTGTVRNMEGGEVEIVATGAPDNHVAFHEQIGIGPSSARVDRVQVEELEPRPFDRFHVIR